MLQTSMRVAALVALSLLIVIPDALARGGGGGGGGRGGGGGGHGFSGGGGRSFSGGHSYSGSRGYSASRSYRYHAVTPPPAAIPRHAVMPAAILRRAATLIAQLFRAAPGCNDAAAFGSAACRTVEHQHTAGCDLASGGAGPRQCGSPKHWQDPGARVSLPYSAIWCGPEPRAGRDSWPAPQAVRSALMPCTTGSSPAGSASPTFKPQLCAGGDVPRSLRKPVLAPASSFSEADRARLGRPAVLAVCL